MLVYKVIAFLFSFVTLVISMYCSKKGMLYTTLLFLVISLVFFCLGVRLGFDGVH